MTHSATDDPCHTGGCHCGRVRFEVRAPPHLELVECSCSICSKSGFLHLLVAGDAFRLLAGDDHLLDYQFGTRRARHLFCKTCGIKSFYVPRSHPDGFSVNAHCLDPGTVEGITVRPFDGEHWEEAIPTLHDHDSTGPVEG